MANNRMYVICLHCLNDDAVTFDDSRIYTGKYYPDGGWNFSKSQADMDAFFQKHLHKTTWEQAMFGDHFTIITESLLKTSDHSVSAKREILEIVAKAAEEGRIGR